MALPPRILLGPGPSELHPAVLQALASPAIGYLDPAFLPLLEQVSARLRAAFCTSNEVTLALTGSGTAGMEAALYNLLEPGDRAVVVVGGYFGARIAEIARRTGADVVSVDVPWGQAVDLDDVRHALAAGPVRLLAAVQGETSTGVLQDVRALGQLARAHDTLLLVDAVASLGGVEMRVDDWQVDICYTGSQKCLGAASGLAPITLGERARRRLAGRTRPPQSWYLDLELVWRYWGPDHVYHHTPSAPLLHALDTALELIEQEGLAERWARHQRVAAGLAAGCEALGLSLLVDPADRLAPLTAVCVPEGVDDAAVRAELLQRFGIEIAGGLAELRGRIWRVGLMGASAQERYVVLFLSALSSILARHGVRCDTTAAQDAAQGAWTA